MENYNIRGMRKNNITDIRYWLAEAIVRIFNIGADNDKIFKTKFYRLFNETKNILY